MFEETLYQSSAAGKPFVDILREQGIVPGIKVDTGLQVAGILAHAAWQDASQCQGTWKQAGALTRHQGSLMQPCQQAVSWQLLFDGLQKLHFTADKSTMPSVMREYRLPNACMISDGAPAASISWRRWLLLPFSCMQP